MTLNFTVEDQPKDDSPTPTEADYDKIFGDETTGQNSPENTDTVPSDGLACVVCGTPLIYAGRGKKPKYCADHKGGRGAATGTVSTRSSSPTLGGTAPAQARAAASMLARLNMLFAMGLNTLGMNITSAQIVTANEEFENLAREALAADPKLARKIIGVGGSSGKAGLTMAYALMGATVAPAVMVDIKAKKAENDS
jgi:hypothetical protein